MSIPPHSLGAAGIGKILGPRAAGGAVDCRWGSWLSAPDSLVPTHTPTVAPPQRPRWLRARDRGSHRQRPPQHGVPLSCRPRWKRRVTDKESVPFVWLGTGRSRNRRRVAQPRLEDLSHNDSQTCVARFRRVDFAQELAVSRELASISGAGSYGVIVVIGTVGASASPWETPLREVLVCLLVPRGRFMTGAVALGGP